MNNDLNEETIALTSEESAAIEREKAILEAIKNGDFVCLSESLAEDYIGVYSQGLKNKAEDVEATKQVKIKSYELSCIKVIFPTHSTSIISYKVEVEGCFQGEDFSGVLFLSSVWVKRHDRWLIIHHTVVKADEQNSSFFA